VAGRIRNADVCSLTFRNSLYTSIMIKLTELFSGIGSQTQALKNLGIAHTAIACERDKVVHGIYEAMHGPTQNLGDITKVTSLPETDVLTYSFPCQDLSSIGNRKGMIEGSGTRSSLLWEVGRLLQTNKPRILILENVKELVSKKNIGDFNKWCEFLESLGYMNNWKLLNAKDFGLPQNRVRCIMVSMLGQKFEFPDIQIPRKSLGEVMQTNLQVAGEFGDIYSGHNPKMAERIYKTINNTQSTNSTNRVYCPNSIVHALTTQGSHPGNFGAILYDYFYDSEFALREKAKNKPLCDVYQVIGSTRLATPRDCFRLMGFSDKSFDKAKKYCDDNKKSYSNLYHCAGNSIAVPVLEYIFSCLDIL
jgi:DNA (cytosine-5)-methyltransferase 1